MENIKVNKQELLTIVKENRKKHKKEYSESIKAYRVKVGDLLTQELQKIVSGDKFNARFDVIKPESHEKEYDLSIKMLEMSVDENIDIDQHTFNQLVNDEWDWKFSFRSSVMSNAHYVGYESITGSTCGSSGSSGTNGHLQDIKFSEDELDEEEI